MIVRYQPIYRGVMAALTIFALALTLVLVGSHGRASADHVKPVLIEGNENCSATTGLAQVLRLEDDELSDGTYPVESGGSITIDVSSDIQSVSWSSDGVLIGAVFVKGGPDGYLYDYRPDGATSDSGLISPPNPGGQDPTISHISFCVAVTSTTATPSSTDAPATSEDDSGIVGSTTASTEATEDIQEPGPTEASDASGATEPTEQVSGQVETDAPTSSIEPEVLGTEILPFTGLRGEGFGMFALALVSAGLLFIVGARSIEH